MQLIKERGGIIIKKSSVYTRIRELVDKGQHFKQNPLPIYDSYSWNNQ